MRSLAKDIARVYTLKSVHETVQSPRSHDILILCIKIITRNSSNWTASSHDMWMMRSNLNCFVYSLKSVNETVQSPSFRCHISLCGGQLSGNIYLSGYLTRGTAACEWRDVGAQFPGRGEHHQEISKNHTF